MGTGMEDPPDSIEDTEEDTMMQELAIQPLNTRDTEIGKNVDGLKGDHNTRKHDDRRANMDPDDQPRLEGTSPDINPVSSKRTKKLKTDREAVAPRERTRSKTRLKTPQGL